MPHSPVVHTSERKGIANTVLGTRNLMTIAALAVVGSMVLVPLNYITPALLVTAKGIVLSCALMGLWVIPFLLPLDIIRRPGAALVASFIMGVITAFTHPMGPIAIIGTMIGGLFIELPLAVMLYRQWTWWAYGIAATCFGLLNSMPYNAALSAVDASVWQKVLMMALSVVSAWVGVVITLALARGLRRAGVGTASHHK